MTATVLFGTGMKLSHVLGQITSGLENFATLAFEASIAIVGALLMVKPASRTFKVPITPGLSAGEHFGCKNNIF